MDCEVGWCESQVVGGLQKDFWFLRLVAVHSWQERSEVDPPVGPAGVEKAVLKLLGELLVTVDLDASW